MQLPVYLDNASTTPIDPRVAEKMCAWLTGEGQFGNPASRSHLFGWRAEEAVETARIQVAELLSCDTRAIVWTSGATESDNLAIKGVAHQHAARGKHIITSMIEHKAVLDSCAQLEREGFDVTYLRPDAQGLISLQQIEDSLRDDSILVSLMHVNNEIGVINDIAAIGTMLRERGVLFHVDAAQSTGKLPIDLGELPVDLMSLTSHKTYGPKGIGALYVSREPLVTLEPLIHGGGHERGMRSGTLPTHQIVGMGEAYSVAGTEMAAETTRLRAQRDRLWQGLQRIDGVSLNGDMQQRIVANLNVSFAGVDGESLMMGLKDLAVSSGSACTSESLEPSYVLRALGVPDELGHASLRLSLGRFTRDEEIDFAIERLAAVVATLRQRSQPGSASRSGAA